MEADHLRENPQTPQQQDSSKQSSHQTKRNNQKSYLQLGSSNNRYTPTCPNKKQNHLHFFFAYPLPFGGSPFEAYPWTSGKSNHHRQCVAKNDTLPTEPRGYLRNKIISKQLAPTDPILGPENFLKTGFAEKGLPSSYKGIVIILQWSSLQCSAGGSRAHAGALVELPQRRNGVAAGKVSCWPALDGQSIARIKYLAGQLWMDNALREYVVVAQLLPEHISKLVQALRIMPKS